MKPITLVLQVHTPAQAKFTTTQKLSGNTKTVILNLLYSWAHFNFRICIFT